MEAALAALDEKTLELEETASELESKRLELQCAQEEVENLQWIIDNPDEAYPVPGLDEDETPEPDGYDITPDEIDNSIVPGLDEDEIDNPVLLPKPTLAPPQQIRNPFIETTIEVEVS